MNSTINLSRNMELSLTQPLTEPSQIQNGMITHKKYRELANEPVVRKLQYSTIGREIKHHKDYYKRRRSQNRDRLNHFQRDLDSILKQRKVYQDIKRNNRIYTLKHSINLKSDIKTVEKTQRSSLEENNPPGYTNYDVKTLSKRSYQTKGQLRNSYLQEFYSDLQSKTGTSIVTDRYMTSRKSRSQQQWKNWSHVGSMISETQITQRTTRRKLSSFRQSEAKLSIQHKESDRKERIQTVTKKFMKQLSSFIIEKTNLQSTVKKIKRERSDSKSSWNDLLNTQNNTQLNYSNSNSQITQDISKPEHFWPLQKSKFKKERFSDILEVKESFTQDSLIYTKKQMCQLVFPDYSKQDKLSTELEQLQREIRELQVLNQLKKQQRRENRLDGYQRSQTVSPKTSEFNIQEVKQGLFEEIQQLEKSKEASFGQQMNISVKKKQYLELFKVILERKQRQILQNTFHKLKTHQLKQKSITLNLSSKQNELFKNKRKSKSPKKKERQSLFNIKAMERKPKSGLPKLPKTMKIIKVMNKIAMKQKHQLRNSFYQIKFCMYTQKNKKQSQIDKNINFADEYIKSVTAAEQKPFEDLVDLNKYLQIDNIPKELDRKQQLRDQLKEEIRELRKSQKTIQESFDDEEEIQAIQVESVETFKDVLDKLNDLNQESVQIIDSLLPETTEERNLQTPEMIMQRSTNEEDQSPNRFLLGISKEYQPVTAKQQRQKDKLRSQFQSRTSQSSQAKKTKKEVVLISPPKRPKRSRRGKKRIKSKHKKKTIQNIFLRDFLKGQNYQKNKRKIINGKKPTTLSYKPRRDDQKKRQLQAKKSSGSKISKTDHKKYYDYFQQQTKANSQSKKLEKSKKRSENKQQKKKNIKKSQSTQILKLVSRPNKRKSPRRKKLRSSYSLKKKTQNLRSFLRKSKQGNVKKSKIVMKLLFPKSMKKLKRSFKK